MRAFSTGDRVGERYRIERTLASGAMGALFAAIDDDGGAHVAVKVIRADVVDEKNVARFRVEAEAMRRLVHPNIVRLLDFGVDDGSPFLVLELLEGETIDDTLQARGRMPWRDGVRVLLGIARALAAAHEARVVHRDLKPKNVFLCANGDSIDGRVRVLDFGIAKILDERAPRVQTSVGAIVGTPGYIAPERMRLVHDDPKSDLYALGAIAWDVLANRAPFEAKTHIALSLKHMTAPAPHLLTFVDVPDELDALVGSLLMKDPKLRPESAAVVVARLEALLAESTP